MADSRIIALAAGIAACGACFASASDEQHEETETVVSREVDFTTLDRNADEFLTAVEARVIGDLDEAYARLDVDGNLLLSREEFALWERAGKPAESEPADPATRPRGSAGAQHVRHR